MFFGLICLFYAYDKSLSISEIRKLSESIQDEKLRDSIIRGARQTLRRYGKNMRSFSTRCTDVIRIASAY